MDWEINSASFHVDDPGFSLDAWTDDGRTGEADAPSTHAHRS